MKLLSMLVEGHNRSGILIGGEVLDVTAYCEIMELKGEWIEAESDPTQFQHIEGAYRDALDVLRHGLTWRNNILATVESTPLLVGELKATGALIPLSAVRLNPPVVNPGKILAVGYEAELAVVIGKEARSVSADRAMEYVAGYTIMNDVTARDLQKRERQWVRAKGLDTFAPCGPWLVTTDEIADPHNLDIELVVNGEVRQNSNTGDLIFKIPQLIEFISQDMTLKAGDIISTGTPSGVGVYMNPPVFLKDGDRIDITIEGVGVLSNPVSRPG